MNKSKKKKERIKQGLTFTVHHSHPHNIHGPPEYHSEIEIL